MIHNVLCIFISIFMSLWK